MYIIRAIPGSCGDIVTAVIDNNDSFLSPHGAILFNNNRRVLKNPQIDLNNISTLLEKMSSTYGSISCQHYAEAIMKYPNITISVNTDSEYDWCVHRLKMLYPNDTFVKENLKKQMEFHSTHSNFKIDLLDILSGKLIECLTEYEIPLSNNELYFKWLDLNSKNFPYNF